MAKYVPSVNTKIVSKCQTVCVRACACLCVGGGGDQIRSFLTSCQFKFITTAQIKLSYLMSDYRPTT